MKRTNPPLVYLVSPIIAIDFLKRSESFSLKVSIFLTVCDGSNCWLLDVLFHWYISSLRMLGIQS